ncbi:hypothetical protein ZWY2020_049194 [Hordeum vulgare]|nr:hypothetical protein ZWY2020_049194 [Hordeum vulgare]
MVQPAGLLDPTTRPSRRAEEASARSRRAPEHPSRRAWGAERFSLQEDSSKRTPSYPSSSASGVREDSQLQLKTIPTNPIHRWSPSLPDNTFKQIHEGGIIRLW